MKGRVIAVIIATVLKAISPLIRKSLDDMVNNLYQRALETDVEFDDVLVETLAELLDVDLK